MTNEELKKANELKKQIHEIECFLITARNSRSGKLLIKRHKPKLFFKANGYGFFESKEFELNTELKNEVVKLMKEKLKEMKKEFENIGKEMKGDSKL